MIKLYNKEKLVAFQRGELIVPIDGISESSLPFGLFCAPFSKPQGIPIFTFLKWCADRCMPRTRLDMKEVIHSLGLDCYNQMAIVERTGAVLPQKDNFWVDFGTKESIKEYDEDRGVVVL